MIRLQDVAGLWRRALIARPGGRSDTTTDVYWLQGPRCYADLRIPAGRPARAGIACLRDLNWAMLRFMAHQEGFFGQLDIVEGIGQWHRAFDYQPDTGVADRGALAFDDGVLVERGVDRPYVEHWWRESAGDAMALTLTTEAGAPGCLVVVGDAFIYARGRAAPSTNGETLDQVVERAPSLEAAQDLFDCEISFGRRQVCGNAGGWRIERSSHCFREGAALSPALDGNAGLLVVDDVTPEGTTVKRAWSIVGHESTSDAPLSHWLEADASRPAASKQEMTIETLGEPR